MPVELAPVTTTDSTAPLPQAISVTLAAQVPANAAPPSLSTASRLVRQSGNSRNADPVTAPGDGPGTPSTASGAAPIAVAATATITSITSPATTPPQDFAALVDRLLEARASQGSTSQKISATVTHADFGNVSLTFQQDTAGLSVSMSSPDPAFARAAQSALANVGTSVGTSMAQAGPSHTTTTNQLLSGPVGNQGLAGSFSQSSAQPDSPAQSSGGPAPQNAPNFSAGGGSQQSQAQPQPKQHQGAGFIAAANRPPPASGNAANSAPATSQGIFA
jgi:hypothetical protein